MRPFLIAEETITYEADDGADIVTDIITSIACYGKEIDANIKVLSKEELAALREEMIKNLYFKKEIAEKYLEYIKRRKLMHNYWTGSTKNKDVPDLWENMKKIVQQNHSHDSEYIEQLFSMPVYILKNKKLYQYDDDCKKIAHGKPFRSEGDVCAVCWESFDQYNIVNVLKWNHEFHAECIQYWLLYNEKCPLWKQVVLNKQRYHDSSFHEFFLRFRNIGMYERHHLI